MSGVLTTKLGALRDVSGVFNPGGVNSTTIDFPGPQADKFWIVDSASLLAAWTNLASFPEFVLSGFFLVPANQPPINDPVDVRTTAADLVNRGIALMSPVDFVPLQLTPGFSYGLWLLRRPIIIPYGYMLRAVLQPPAAVAMTFTQLLARALVRELPLDDCEPIPVCEV